MFFTIMTPSFNRAHTLHRVYSSLCEQEFKDFEWIIIDDGSTDNTEKLVEKFIREGKIEKIHYIKKQNQGKVIAVNDALKISSGDWFIVFDSDDWCTEDALLQIYNEIEELTKNNILTEYSGISCLKAYNSGEVVGEDYSRMSKYGESYIDRFNKRIDGDKWEIIRTDIHRSQVYDIEENEKYMAPSYAWLKIGKIHKTVFLNKVLSIIEYQKDGITRNNIKHRAGSPLSTARYYSYAESISSSKFMRYRCQINKERFYFHAKKNEIPMTPTKIIAYFLYTADRKKLASMKKNSR